MSLGGANRSILLDDWSGIFKKQCEIFTSWSSCTPINTIRLLSRTPRIYFYQVQCRKATVVIVVV